MIPTPLKTTHVAPYTHQTPSLPWGIPPSFMHASLPLAAVQLSAEKDSTIETIKRRAAARESELQAAAAAAATAAELRVQQLQRELEALANFKQRQVGWGLWAFPTCECGEAVPAADRAPGFTQPKDSIPSTSLRPLQRALACPLGGVS